MSGESGMNKPLLGIAVAVLLAAGAAWLYWHNRAVAPGPARADAALPAAVPSSPENSVAYPVPAAASPATNLPDLNESDHAVGDALTSAAGGAAASQYLNPVDVVRHIVVTVDNLPRQKVAVNKLPTVAVPGTFAVNGDELHATLDQSNFERYQPMVSVLSKVDMQRLAAAYLHLYPLFQRAYQDLGYPNGYFNDRLIQVIDGLLATPQLNGPIELVRPNVMYTFADPTLEARPAGQKLLIRMGPDNEKAVKTKLAELRAAIIAARATP